MSFVVCLFHERGAADKVCTQAKLLTNAKLWVDIHNHDDKGPDAAGKWAIVCDNDNLSYTGKAKVSRAIDTAIQMALYVELAKCRPDALLSIWHLKPENLQKVRVSYRIGSSDSDFKSDRNPV